MVFVSNDRLQELVAPRLVDVNQVFLPRNAFKDDLAADPDCRPPAVTVPAFSMAPFRACWCIR